MARYNFKYNIRHYSLGCAVLAASVEEIEEYCQSSPFGETYLVIDKLDMNNLNNCHFVLVREPNGVNGK